MRWFTGILTTVTLLLFITAPAAILPGVGSVFGAASISASAPLWFGLAAMGVVAVIVTYFFVHPLWRTDE